MEQQGQGQGSQVGVPAGSSTQASIGSRLLNVFAPAWRGIQMRLFPWLEDGLGPLTAQQKKLVTVLEIIRIENFIVNRAAWLPGRPPKDRAAIARSFLAKAVFNLPTTRALIERLQVDRQLRVLCGWQDELIPSESVFSRAFGVFASTTLGERVHAALIDGTMGDRLVGHLSRDATEIEARERPDRETMKQKAEAKKNKPKRKRGRPKKGEQRPKESTRLQRQLNMNPDKMIAELPTACDVGTKRNSKGHQQSWIGYKLHVDVADGQIPISCILTSASVHDSQVALPLAAISAQRVTNLYDLMDSAYDADEIKLRSRELGHVPIIDVNPRRDTTLKLEIKAEAQRQRLLGHQYPEKVRYNERTAVERVYGRLKDEFGARHIRVRGHAKIMSHLMFGVLVLTADQLLRLLT